MEDKAYLLPKTPVAQYLRMSTEHQQYSIHNQAEFIAKYAAKNNMEILYTYDDAGKSGISISGRDSLQKLVYDVMESNIQIQAVLIYDVSRFGRFQEIDEGAYYTHLFRMHGVELVFCAEPLPTKDFPLEASIMLNLRRAAAANLSKNLSDKVFLGQVNLIKRGYHQGGMAGYGLRRILVDERGNEKEILDFGKRKSIQTDRVILAPGPVNERRVVNNIYDMFIEQYMPEFLIAEKLNNDGIAAENNTLWTRAKVHQVLTNEKYIGNNVYNKTSSKLKTKTIKNPQNEWVRCNKAYKKVVSIRKFLKAQEIIHLRSKNMTDEDLLEYLRLKLQEKGKLSGVIIDEDDFGPSSSIYKSRFGGLLRAYQLIDYKPEHDYTYLEINNQLRKSYSDLIESFKKEIENCNCKIEDEPNTQKLIINNNMSVSVIVSKCKKLKSGKFRWKIRLEPGHTSDITIVTRMDSNNKIPVDYFILPKLDFNFTKMFIKENNPALFELYRYDDLNFFYHLLKRVDMRNPYAA
ncbi:recombinase family protein [Salmonella enterica]|nr:recombinase family protein [Salmonella enterica]